MQAWNVDSGPAFFIEDPAQPGRDHNGSGLPPGDREPGISAGQYEHRIDTELQYFIHIRRLFSLYGCVRMFQSAVLAEHFFLVHANTQEHRLPVG